MYRRPSVSVKNNVMHEAAERLTFAPSSGVLRQHETSKGHGVPLMYVPVVLLL